MRDRELLERAAKACGINGVFRSFHQAYGDELVEGIDYGGRLFWNPLKDDGDALRLAVKLRMVVNLAECMCCAVVDWHGNEDENEIYVRFSDSFSDRECDTAEQAVRLAITRAAASMADRETTY